MLNCDLVYWKNKSSLNSRIVNEMGNLMFQCESVSFKIIDEDYHIIIKNNNYYEIILSKEYPFKIPKNLFVNKINYRDILKITEPKIKKYLLKYYGLGCLCCSSLMCANNWMPTNYLCHIINDINSMMRIKREIYLYILCDSIKYKYNCEYLNIEEYLF